MSVYLLNDLNFSDGGLTDEDVDLAKINAEKGDAVAQYHLAMMFDSGKGVRHNPKEAEKWYKKSVAQGHTGAAFYLAKMYLSDNSGVAKNEDEALRLLKFAAENGHQGAIAKLYN
jgi:TPR repeat protein